MPEDKTPAKLPESVVLEELHYVRDIQDGETAFVVPTTVLVDYDRSCYLVSDDITFPSAFLSGIRVTRAGSSYGIVIPRHATFRRRHVPDDMKPMLIVVTSIS